jgi:protein SCO1/2
VAALVAICALAGCGEAALDAPTPGARPSAFAGEEMNPPVVAREFALRDQDGRTVRLSSQRGKLAIVAFLYTACPDVCPLIAQNLNDALRSLPAADRAKVRVFAVSVDPVGDTPAAIRRFVRVHRLVREFRYLTGTRRQLETVWRNYALSVAPSSPDTIDHSAYEMLVDQKGDGRVIYDAKVDAQDVVHDVRLLLGAG